MPTNNNINYSPAPLPGTVPQPVLGNNIDRAPAPVAPGPGIGTNTATAQNVLPVYEQPVVVPVVSTSAVIPVVEQAVDTAATADVTQNVVNASQQRYITILANGVVVTNNAATLDFEGNGFTIANLGTNGATITLSGAAGYGNSNVATFLAAFGSNTLSTTGNVTAGYILGNGSQLTGLSATYGNANVATFLAAFGSNTVSTTGNVTGNYFIGNGSQLTSVSTSFDLEMHVSKDGNDSTGTGTILRPYLTITHALTQVAGGRNTIVIHPGGYTENPTITNLATQLITYDATGASTLVYGTVTIANTTGRIAGLKMTNLAITGNAQAYINSSTVDEQFTKSSSGYVEVDDCELQTTGNVLISGSGITTIIGNKIANLVVNNAGASVLIKGANDCLMPQITAGTLNIVDSIIRASSNTANAVTASAGTVVTLMNNQIVTPAADNVARVSIAGFHSIISLVYDKANSTLSNSLNSVAYFQTANVDSLVSSGNITGGNLLTGGLILATGNITAGNLDATNLVINSIRSDDSTFVTIEDGLNVTGPISGLGSSKLDFTTYGANTAYLTTTIDDTTALFMGLVTAELYANTDVSIRANTGGTAQTWTFNSNGTLSAPGNVSAVGNITGNYFIGNGSQLTGISAGANTGNVTFNDQIVLGTGTNDGGGGLYLAPGNASIANSAVQYFRVRGGDVPTHIHLDTGNNDYYDQYFGDDAQYVKLANIGNVVIGAANVSNSAQWSFDPDGNLTLPGNTFAVNYANGTAVSIGGSSYGNSNVASFLGAFGSNTVSTTGNVTAGNLTVGSGTITGGNVNGANFNGNVAFGTGTVGGSGNITGGNLLFGSGVVSGTGNISAGNISVTGNISGNTAGFAIGYRDIPQVSLSSNVTTALTDAGKHYYSVSASNLALTIANNTSVSWPVGTAISIVNRGTANITIAPGSGVSLYLAGNSTSANRTVTTYGMATVMNVAANIWMINGTVV